VVGFPHDIKGQGIFAYVILREGYHESLELIGALKNECRHHIGAIAIPDRVVIVPGLPKTRSGKIMRRILRKVAAGELDSLGDTSTLADPSIVDALVAKVGSST
jgi:acetyl-CoA synthetase